MTDYPQLAEPPEEELDVDYAKEDYATTEAPYVDVLDKKTVKRLEIYEECKEQIDRGVAKVSDGAVDQVDGLYKIWKGHLWELDGIRTMTDWIEGFITYHHVTVMGTESGILRENVFLKTMKGVAKALAVGVDYREALLIGINHTAIEEIERSGTMKWDRVHGGRKKQTEYVATVTPAGHEKLLKGGLITPQQYISTLATMQPRDALKTVQSDVGKAYTYIAHTKEYSGNMPIFDESQAKNYAIEFRYFDPNNGETPYLARLIVQEGVPEVALSDLLSYVKYRKRDQEGYSGYVESQSEHP